MESGSRQLDPLVGAASGGGEYCPEGIPVELGFLSILAAFGVAFGILYRALTVKTGRRRKRSELGEEEGSCQAEDIQGLVSCRLGLVLGGSQGTPWASIADILWHGLEEFEEKIDRIADGEDNGSNSWISKIYDQFSFFNDGSNSLEEAEMEGLEPPILDETWGLGRETKGQGISANATISGAVPLEDKQTSRSRRAAEEAVEKGEDKDTVEEDVEEKCRVEMWRCLSKVVEGGLHYMDKPDGLLSLAKKTMFKMAFHGGLSNVWSGVMTIPEARHIAHCMTSHTECVSYEILRREAQETMDPADPAYIMYNKQKQDKREEKNEQKEQKVHRKRERLIVNPEFVEGLDTGDGSEQYDEDYVQNRV